jgi:hypothetical protein
MGYACPVCEDPQSDGEHLANHLAFTAMLGDDAHEQWLDEHVTDWGERDPADLAAAVTDRADEREFPQLFEDTTDQEAAVDPGDPAAHEHAHGHDHDADADTHGRVPGAGGGEQTRGYTGGQPGGEFSAETREAIERAREMVAEYESADDADGEDSDGESTAGDDSEACGGDETTDSA